MASRDCDILWQDVLLRSDKRFWYDFVEYTHSIALTLHLCQETDGMYLCLGNCINIHKVSLLQIKCKHTRFVPLIAHLFVLQTAFVLDTAHQALTRAIIVNKAFKNKLQTNVNILSWKVFESVYGFFIFFQKQKGQ